MPTLPSRAPHSHPESMCQAGQHPAMKCCIPSAAFRASSVPGLSSSKNFLVFMT